MTTKKTKDKPIKVTELEASKFEDLQTLEAGVDIMAKAMMRASGDLAKAKDALWRDVSEKYNLDITCEVFAYNRTDKTLVARKDL